MMNPYKKLFMASYLIVGGVAVKKKRTLIEIWGMHVPVIALNDLIRMKKVRRYINRDYFRRCKYSSPESKLEWLAAALEFAQTKKRILKKK